MYRGRIVEKGRAAETAPPHHPYTEALLSAVPTISVLTATAYAFRSSRGAAAKPRVAYSPGAARGALVTSARLSSLPFARPALATA